MEHKKVWDGRRSFTQKLQVIYNCDKKIGEDALVARLKAVFPPFDQATTKPFEAICVEAMEIKTSCAYRMTSKYGRECIDALVDVVSQIKGGRAA